MTKELADPKVPDYLKGRSAVELQGIDQEDYATPRLVLLQALSPQVEEGLGKAGNFFHSGSEVDLGSELVVTPCFITKAYTLWRPRPEGGVLARSRDAISWDKTGSWEVKLKGVPRPVTWRIKDKNVKASGLAAWGSSNPDDPDSPPAATLSYNIPVMIQGHYDLGPVALSMQRSQVKVAKKLLGRLRMQTIPYYSLAIPLVSCKDQGPEGPFYNLKFGKFSHVSEKEFNTCEALYNSFKEYGVTVKEDEHEAPEGPKGDGELEDDEIPF
jgi:hypothetical protein